MLPPFSPRWVYIDRTARRHTRRPQNRAWTVQALRWIAGKCENAPDRSQIGITFHSMTNSDPSRR